MTKDSFCQKTYRTNKKEVKKFDINRKTLGFCALIFLSLGCIPAYFDLMFYAKALWILGFATMNTYFFVISYRKM
jgi:hypothetical protein